MQVKFPTIGAQFHEKNKVNYLYNPYPSVGGQWGLQQIGTLYCINLYTWLYIIHVAAQYIPYCFLHGATALFLLPLFFHYLCCPKAHSSSKCFQFIQPFLTDTRLLSKKQFFSTAPAATINQISCFLKHVEFRQNHGRQFKTCRPLQTEQKWCAVHVGRLKSQSND